MAVPTLDELNVGGKRLGVRIDINSPMRDGRLADDARIRAHLDTLAELTAAGGRVAVLAHQGRPGGDAFTGLGPHADRLNGLLDAPVTYVDATFSAAARDAIDDLERGEVVVLENTRFYSEEYMEFPPARAAETYLVERLSRVLDAYVNDAFAAAHRSQPSLVGFPERVPSYAGRVMETELDVLEGIEATERPRVYLLAGAKVADSLDVAERVLERGLADAVLTGGIVGNLFLAAEGVPLGEPSRRAIQEAGVWEARDRVAALCEAHGDRIHTPQDVAVDRDGRGERSVEALPVDAPVYDIGSATIEAYAELLRESATAILNGPVGLVEEPAFETGTRAVYEAATEAGYSVVGGGDTVAALRRFGLEGFDHVSTGGGAVLRLLAGDTLPAVEVLQEPRPTPEIPSDDG